MLRLACCLLVTLALAPASAQPVLTVSPSAVFADGATPDGQVAWLSVSRRPMETHQRIEIRRELGEADLTGRVELALEDEVALKSIWAVIDLATGDFAVATPAEASLRERALLPDAFEPDATGEAVRLRHDRLRVEALIVRPDPEGVRASAWAGQVQDGGEWDEGLAYDGQVALSPRSLPGLLEDQPLAEHFAAGDVIVLIDPERLEVSAVRLEAETGQGGER